MENNTSRTATQSQWQDLATKVKGKQDALTAGTGISINNNVISATGGETMLVTLTQTTIGQYSDVWVWSSNYTFAQLTANPDAIRVFVNDWCYASEGNIKPTDAKVDTSEQSTEIYLVRDLAGVEMSFVLRQPQEIEGQTVNPAIFNVTNFVDKDKTALLILPTLTLADNATSIPDGTTITLQTLSSDQEMYSVNGNSDCYPHERIINGNFMILPVKRKVGSGASSWVEEECLVMSASRRGTSNVSDSYIYKTFMFNGEYYKMTLTSDSYPNVVYTITKIPVGGGGSSSQVVKFVNVPNSVWHNGTDPNWFPYTASVSFAAPSATVNTRVELINDDAFFSLTTPAFLTSANLNGSNIDVELAAWTPMETHEFQFGLTEMNIQ